MKTFKSYLSVAVALAAITPALWSCQDNIDAPAPDAPVATLTPNMSILELKEMFWQDATNYIDTIGVENGIADDKAYVIKGRVVSSDEAGNVFKNIVIQDETAAIAISINMYNLYTKYRRGQEVVIDLKGMYIGKYNGLIQLGYPEWYANGNAWEASFMPPEFFFPHVQLNGYPEPAKIDTLVVNRFSELPSNPAGLQKWQSQLVRFNNVYFQDGGTEMFSEYQSSGVSRTIVDAEGSQLTVRTSGYANFWNQYLPKGQLDLVAILGYYGTTGWQLTLIDADGCINVGNPTVEPGAKENPYTVAQAIAVEQQGLNRSGWVKGFIVGCVAPEVETITSNDDIEWTADVTLANTLVIGETADTKDLSQCVVISLPSGSKLRDLGNLRDNPANYLKAINVYGTLGMYMGTYGILDNNGTLAEFEIDGVSGGGEAQKGDGSEEKPYNVSQVIAMNPSSTSEATAAGVWVTGYIVGWADMSSTYYINAETQRFSVPATMATNILVAGSPDVQDYTQCIGVQLPSGTVRSALNLQNNPQNLGKQVMLKGDIMKYSGVPGLKNTSDYKLDGGDTPTPGPEPANPVTSIDETFEGGAIPATWTQVQVSGDKTWYTPSFDNNYYAAMTGYKGTKPPFDQWLITPPVDMSKVSNKTLSFDTQVNGYGSTTSVLEVYVMTTDNPATATLTKLNPTLATAPASGYSSWVSSGNIDLAAYTGIIYIGFRYYATSDANYATWCVDNVKLNASSSVDPNPNPNPDPQPTGEYKGDFNSFNNSTPKSSYSTYTNATGWTATNCAILSGSSNASASNPYFTFIGADGTLAPTLNGKTSAAGSLKSPTLTGGIGTLTFNYGFAFTETKCSFTVRILQGGNVVKEDTVTLDSLEKAKAYDYSLDVNVSGDFVIEIVNNCLSAQDKNIDRVSIWNLTWN